MTAYRKDPPPDILRDMIIYDNGVLRWKPEYFTAARRARRNVNVIGSYDNHGYLRANFTGADIGMRNIKVHRIIYWLHTGEWPPVIDHINGIKDDNRIENLRAATEKQNARNKGLRATNKTGYIGVYYNHGNYSAVVVDEDGKRQVVRGFHDAKHAALFRDLMAHYTYGEFAKLNFLGKSKIRIGGQVI
ncbi:HNH endonuclease [Salmonella enterica]|nr:HNH endonuclease [Salmonella enterica]EEO4608500.1 HNH endonuclease [Salmonella enterica]EGP0845504.1 HNH endonuclease [Salmonella enterica]EGP0863716.1 HNH endonuclease [Salmonella enterica]